MPAAIEWRVVTLGKRFAGSAETLTAIMAGSECRKNMNKTKIENRFVSLCAKFNADFKTVLVFFLALIVMDFYSFENLKKKKNKKKNEKNFMNKIELEFKFTYGVQISSKSVNSYIKNHPLKRGRTLMCMAGRVLKRIARENVNVNLTLPASLPSNSSLPVDVALRVLNRVTV